MKKFKDFLSELYHVPVISIEKSHNNIKTEEGLNELNKNLSTVLSHDFSTIEEGLNKAKKVLSMYGIELPQIHFKDERKGTLKIPVGQFKSSGEVITRKEPMSKPFSEKNEFHNFVFNYELIDGKYTITAEVTKK